MTTTNPSGPPPRQFQYKCMVCGKEYAKEDRHDLAVKRAVFMEMGEGARTIRSRVIGWLCKTPCMEDDADYQREPWGQSPGFKGTKLDPKDPPS